MDGSRDGVPRRRSSLSSFLFPIDARCPDVSMAVILCCVTRLAFAGCYISGYMLPADSFSNAEGLLKSIDTSSDASRCLVGSGDPGLASLAPSAGPLLLRAVRSLLGISSTSFSHTLSQETPEPPLPSQGSTPHGGKWGFPVSGAMLRVNLAA